MLDSCKEIPHNISITICQIMKILVNYIKITRLRVATVLPLQIFAYNAKQMRFPLVLT